MRKWLIVYNSQLYTTVGSNTSINRTKCRNQSVPPLSGWSGAVPPRSTERPTPRPPPTMHHSESKHPWPHVRQESSCTAASWLFGGCELWLASRCPREFLSHFRVFSSSISKAFWTCWNGLPGEVKSNCCHFGSGCWRTIIIQFAIWVLVAYGFTWPFTCLQLSALLRFLIKISSETEFAVQI